MNGRKNHVLIVGGGASGMIAAIAAKRSGADVTILERNSRVGKKILATGNGRCNYTNLNTKPSCYYGSDPTFAESALANFDVEATIHFFEKLGITPKIEERGKVFPMSEQASSLLDVFLYELNKIGVQIVCDALVEEISRKKGKFKLKLENGTVYEGDKVILATGGKAMPSSGSDGKGFDLVKKLGHSVTDIFPALVQLMLEGAFFKQIDGVKFVGTAELLHKNELIAQDRGDILFANYGVSGPPILQLSRKAGELLQVKKEAILKITIVEGLSKDELREILEERFTNDPQKTVAFSLVGLINKRLIPVILKEVGIESKTLVSELKLKDQENILAILKDWRFTIRGTKSWPSSQVTAGGVSTKEINKETLESKLVKGLFLTGEIIDIDGQCGGFNLQWAWSSGFLAGKNAARG